jgi:SAM-dependent methyltransferase
LTPLGTADRDRDVFNRAGEYAEMLDRGLRLTGEGREYFVAGRIALLRATVSPAFSPIRIMDYGCGTGETAIALARTYAGSRVTGIDTSAGAIDLARTTYDVPQVQFSTDLGGIEEESFDLCYVNGVFHHISPGSRGKVLEWIRSRLTTGGLLALFENNPWNPGTRLVMKRIPFDRNAQTISPRAGRAMLVTNGFRVDSPTRHVFFFPSALRALRRWEPHLRRIPLGGQYLIVGRKA